MDFGMHCPHAERAMQFLQRIGLEAAIEPDASGFIEHIRIVDGRLHVDPRAPASGILHEAGHLAIMPSRFRHYLSGDVSKGMSRMLRVLRKLDLEPDSPLMRAAMQTGDPEATAWAWSAGKAIGIPDELIIRDEEYSDEGEFIRISLAANAYLGINGISHAGFCVPRLHPYRPLPVFPDLAFWLQH